MADGSKRHKHFFPLLIAFSIVIVLCAFVASIPRILSTQWGKAKLFAYVKSKYRLDVKCEQLSLEWFGRLETTHLEVTDLKKTMHFTCSTIQTEASLWDVLFKKDFGHLHLDQPHLTIPSSLASFIPMRIPQVTEIQRASFIPLAQGGKWVLHVPYFGTLECVHGKIELLAEGMHPIVFDEISLNVENPRGEHAVHAQIDCKTLQKEIQGTLQADTTFVRLNTDTPILKATAAISKLPIAGIDEIVGLFKPHYGGLLVQALGDTADVAFNGHSTAGHFEIDLTVASPLFKGQLSMATAENTVSLKSPAQFSYTLTPACFKKLTEMYPKLQAFSLQSNTTWELALSQFESRIPHSVNDMLTASFDAQVTALSPLAFVCNSTPIALNDCKLQAISDGGTIRFNGNGALFSAEKSAPSTIEGIFDPLKKQMSFSATAADVPTIILNQITGINTLATLIGDRLSFNAKFSTQDSVLNLTARTPIFTLQKAVFEISDRWSLRSPVDFEYLMLPLAMKTFAHIEIAETAKLYGKINAFSLPQSSLERAEIDLQISSDCIAFSIPGTAQNTSINHLMAHLSVHTLDKISLSLSSDRLQGHLTGKYQLKTDKATFTEPLTWTATVDDVLLHAFIPTPLVILKPVDVKLSIDPFSCNLQKVALEELSIKGNAAADSFSAAPYANAPEITMQNLTLPFQWDGPKKIAQVGLGAAVQEKGQPLGSITMNCTLTNVQRNRWNEAQAVLSFDIQQMPSTFIDSLAGKKILAPLLGSQFSTNVKIQSSPIEQTIGINLTSPLCTLKSTFLANGKTLALLNAPTQIQWTLTPEGYNVLDKLLTQHNAKVSFELKEPSRFQFTMSKLELPLANPSTGSSSRIPNIHFDLSQLQCAGDMTNSNIAFFDHSSQETISVSSLALSLSKLHNAPLNAACDANITSMSLGKNNVTRQSGSISLKGTVERLCEKEGAIDLDTLSSQITLQVKSFPSRLLDLLARLKGRTDYPFTKIFGNTIQASLQANVKNLSGPVTLNVNSPNVRFSLDTVLCSTGLMLEKPIYAQMKITKEMSALFLKEVNPLSISYFYSENPVTLEIPAKGVYLPLNPFNVNLLTIPTARIELGKVACRNEGNVNIALGLLKTKQFEKNKELLLWFAPMDLHISKGVIHVERTEILLAQAFEIALWGQVDLADQYVDMVLGLPAPTLKSAFGIKNLPDDYVLTIPMKGPADNVKINSSKATTKIALLLAAQQKALQQSLGKSQAGQLFGGLLQQMATLPDNGNVPPAKHPFPWEKNSSSVEDPEQTQQKKLHFKQNEKPLKQLLKIIR